MPTAKTIRLLGLGLLGLLGACHSGPDEGQAFGDVVTATDFESLAGWGCDVNNLTDAHAHSGRLATFVNADHEFGLTYRLPIGRANIRTIKALDTKFWVYLPSDKANATFTVQVFRPASAPPGPPLYSAEVRLLDHVHDYAKWREVQHVFVLPVDLPYDAELRFFLWRGGSPEPVYLDDLTVKARG